MAVSIKPTQSKSGKKSPRRKTVRARGAVADAQRTATQPTAQEIADREAVARTMFNPVSAAAARNDFFTVNSRANMPRRPLRTAADADLVKPGDIVWLDAKHLTPTRGSGHTWPHNAICLYHYYQNQAMPHLIVSGTVFQFVCITPQWQSSARSVRTSPGI